MLRSVSIVNFSYTQEILNILYISFSLKHEFILFIDVSSIIHFQLKLIVSFPFSLSWSLGQLSGSPAVLHVPILQPNLRSEQLLVTVDTHTGVLLPSVPQYDSCPIIPELQVALNHDHSKLHELISELRWVASV